MKITIKWKTILAVVFLITVALINTSTAQEKFERSVYYDVIASGKLQTINDEMVVVQNSSSSIKEGYEGTLLMRKAGLLVIPIQKLKFFKEGRIKLETALAADPDNTELHFLRLIIQENAPAIVKYHKDIEGDKAIIQKNFKSLSPALQHAIIDYSKNSKVLHAEDF